MKYVEDPFTHANIRFFVNRSPIDINGMGLIIRRSIEMEEPKGVKL